MGKDRSSTGSNSKAHAGCESNSPRGAGPFEGQWHKFTAAGRSAPRILQARSGKPDSSQLRPPREQPPRELLGFKPSVLSPLRARIPTAREDGPPRRGLVPCVSSCPLRRPPSWSDTRSERRRARGLRSSLRVSAGRAFDKGPAPPSPLSVSDAPSSLFQVSETGPRRTTPLNRLITQLLPPLSPFYAPEGLASPEIPDERRSVPGLIYGTREKVPSWHGSRLENKIRKRPFRKRLDRNRRKARFGAVPISPPGSRA